MKVIKNFTALERILYKLRRHNKKLEENVHKIISNVRERGDEALIEYTKKFDKVKLTPRELRVTETEISSAFNELNSSLITYLKKSIDNVLKFYRSQIPKPLRLKESNGKIIKVSYSPLERVGIYIPAGTAPLISTVYMSIIPAYVAGVKEIVLVSPPSPQKLVNPFILAAVSMLKIKEIYKVGGAQAIASLAWGTKTIKKVDKIVGPGNEYVTEAKRQVFGYVDIDMLAGPSEVVIIAGKKANPQYILVDLEAQMEHHSGIGIVITNSKRIFNELASVKLDAYLLKVNTMEEAIEMVNSIAPEHLEIFTHQPAAVAKYIRNAGAIFLGENTPTALGDYTAGPSHILPTGGRARFFSPLSLKDFLREIHIISYSKKALQEEFPVLEKIASLEGMRKHIDSVRARIGGG